MTDLFVLRITSCAACHGAGTTRGTYVREGQFRRLEADANGPHRTICPECHGSPEREERVPFLEALKEVGLDVARLTELLRVLRTSSAEMLGERNTR